MSPRWSLSVCFALAFAAFATAQETSLVEPPRQPADPLDGPPLVTARGWVIGDGKTGQRLWGHADDSPRAIASTTKIMTAWLVIQRAEKDPAVLDELITFSERADKTGGSTSGVKAGEKITVRNLLYGLMLPSGNDASVAFAEHFGRSFAEEAAGGGQLSDEESVEAFVAQMNRTAAALDMKHTRYLDPHGLGNNRSTPADLLKLTHAAMQSELFRAYVSTRQHKCTVITPEDSQHEASWRNTNQTLNIEGFDGVKTGTTSAAGACLVASCHRGKDHLLVVVLGSTSTDARYVDARNLLRWAWQQRQ